MKVYLLAFLVVPLAYAQNVDINQHTYDINHLKDSRQQILDDHQRTCEMLVQSCLNRKGVAELQAEQSENEREVFYVENASETDKTFEEKMAPRGPKRR